MNTETHLLRRSISPPTSIRAAALAALFTLAPVAAFADPPPVPAPDTRVAKVSLAGLDLSTPEGARAARDRLKIVAERLCLELGDDRKIDFQAVYFACVHEALADAVRRINAPTLAALDKSRTEP
jgi:UrcA family protein